MLLGFFRESLGQGVSDASAQRPLLYNDAVLLKAGNEISNRARESGMKTGSAFPAVTPELSAQFSYAIGVDAVRVLRSIKDSIDFRVLSIGIQDGMEKRASRMDINEKSIVLAAAQSELADKNLEISAKNGAESSEFLVKNGQRATVKTTTSGLQYEVISQGTGVHPQDSSLVTVAYTGA